MLDIIAIVSNKGYFISKGPVADRHSWNDYSLSQYLFNGKKAEPSFHKDWMLIPLESSLRVSHMESQPNINYRFVLTDDSLASDKIPLTLTREQVMERQDCEGNVIWKPEYAMYLSLYVEVSDDQPPKEIEDEITFRVLFSIGEIAPPPEFKYPVEPGWHDGKTIPQSVSSGVIVHQELGQIIFPTLLTHLTPCRLSPENTFKIVRQYIKDNIDPRVAKISSDYDFHFEVRKRIPITKPYVSKYERTPRGRRRPEIKYTTISETERTIYEIATEKRSYGNPIILQGFEGKDESDLKDKVDTYLKDLMAFINEPVKECPTCCGSGVLFNPQLPNKEAQC